MAPTVARSLNRGSAPALVFSVSRIGALRSPLETYGFILLAMVALMTAGLVVGLDIIEEKESDTLRALTVTPLRRGELIAGRSMIGLLMPLVQLLLLVWILGIADANIPMLMLTMLLSATSAILVGFLLGVLSSSQMSGIANGKLLFLMYSIAPAGAVFLPEGRHVFLYWTPAY